MWEKAPLGQSSYEVQPEQEKTLQGSKLQKEEDNKLQKEEDNRLLGMEL